MPGANTALLQLQFNVNIFYPHIPEKDMAVFAFLLASGGKVRGEGDVYFHGKNNDEACTILLNDKADTEKRAVCSFDLSKVDQEIEKIAIVLSYLDNQLKFENTSSVKLEVPENDFLRGEIPCIERKESALILAEIYRRNNAWKLRIVGQGFGGGLDSVTQHYSFNGDLLKLSSLEIVSDYPNSVKDKETNNNSVKESKTEEVSLGPEQETSKVKVGINKYLKEKLGEMGGRTWIAPNIPANKLSNAVNAFKYSGDSDSIIGVCDNSLLNSAKEGFLITGSKFIYKEAFEQPIEIDYEKILSVEYITLVSTNAKGKEKKIDKLQITQKSGKVNEAKADLLNLAKLADIITEAVEHFDSYEEQNQLQPIQELPEPLKIAYLKIVVNMAFDNEGQVDDKEFAEILQLMTRLHLKPESRNEIRIYIGAIDNIESVQSLVKVIDLHAPDGMEKSLHISLIKDLISINTSLNNSVSSDFGFLRKHRDVFDVSDDEISLAKDAISNDRKLLDRAYTDNAVAKSVKELSAKAGAVGVPLGAVYLSGSVVGLSAAGMSSGLASMGMGGILGFSSMATGIGTVVILGVVAYKSIKHLTGTGIEEGDKRREVMLLEIIRQNQRTLNMVIEDINFLTNDLTSALTVADTTREQLNQLAAKLSRFIRASKVVGKHAEQAEADRTRLKSPEFLDVGRLRALTQDYDKKKYFEFVMGFYKEEVQIEEKDGKSVEKTVLRLAPSHDSESLEELGKVVDMLGYSTTQGAVKASYKNTEEIVKEELKERFKGVFKKDE